MSHQLQILENPAGHARLRTITIKITSAQPDERVSGWGESLIVPRLHVGEIPFAMRAEHNDIFEMPQLGPVNGPCPPHVA
jgi:hypothetical protein